MRLDGIDELDLNGVLFVQFPDSMPINESREMLEVMVADVYDERYSDVPEDERPEMVLSPYWIYLALCEAGWKDYARLGKNERKKAIEEAVARRAERFAR
jgi:hypothetical protein